MFAEFAGERPHDYRSSWGWMAWVWIAATWKSTKT
jgi:hypothetical protein